MFPGTEPDEIGAREIFFKGGKYGGSATGNINKLLHQE
jgi:hypothetical protein